MTGKRTVAVLGAGPMGIEAAAAAARVGFEVRVFERGEIGASTSLWGHVRMFTPWRMNRSTLGAKLAREAGAGEPDADECPTGDELVAQYLLPLASHPLLRGRIEAGARVVAVSRDATLKGDLLGKPERRAAKFRVLVERDGVEKVFPADAVVDATGTFATPRWLGSGGVPAPGERHALITRHLPDMLGRDQVTYEGQRVLVVGSGLSAATAVRDLAQLAESAPATRVVWAVRHGRERPVEPIANDPLVERARLVETANALALGSPPRVELRRGVSVEKIVRDGDGARVTLRTRDGVRPGVEERFDRVLSLVGYRPDRSLWEELQVHECYATGAPMKLAAALLASGGAAADCLAQTTHGPETLTSPEPDFLVVGAKSYGRASNFLLRTGHDQVRDAMTLLTGVARDLV